MSFVSSVDDATLFLISFMPTMLIWYVQKTRVARDKEYFLTQRFGSLEKAAIGRFCIFCMFFGKMHMKNGREDAFCMKSSKMVIFFDIFFGY